MNNKTIGIIVPAYNAQTSISRCLDSLVNQSYTNISIIVINDGSTDKTKEICESYVNKDSRITLINQDNQGVSAARNTGLDYINTDYVMFCDSDDEYHRDCCKIMLENYRDGYLTMCNHNDKLSSINLITTRKLLTGDFLGYQNIAINALWNKIYDLSIINNHNIRFTSELSNGEDLVFNLEYFKYINRNITYIEQPLYLYNNSQESLSKSIPTISQTELLYKHIIEGIYALNSEVNQTLLNKAKTFIMFDYEKIIVEVLKDQSISFINKIDNINKIFKTSTYKEACHVGVGSTNSFYNSLFKYKLSFLLVLLFGRQ